MRKITTAVNSALDSQESLRVQKLEDDCIPQVAAMTAASPLIAKTYEALYPRHRSHDQ